MKAMKKSRKAMAGIMLAACFAATCRADQRSYVWTTEYELLPAGIAEVEYYLTTKVPDTGVKESSTWQHQVEIEYGLTDNWNIGLYQVFKQSYESDSTSSFKYDGFKLKTKHKLLKRGEFFVDPLIVVEYIRKADLAESDALEGKLVLSKDIGKFNLDYNAIVEHSFGSDDETEHEYAAGMKYIFLPGFSAGLELKGNYSDDKHAAGPVVAAVTEKIWVALGAVFGLNSATDDLQARMIAGVVF